MALNPGPATIEIATDVMAAVTEAVPARVTRVAAPAPDPEAVARVRGLIDAAEAPLIWAGGGARHAAAAVRALAEALDAPVITTYNGKGVLPSAHPLHAGSSVEEAAMQKLVERSDLVLALGTRFSQEATANWACPCPRRSSRLTSIRAASGARLRSPREWWPILASSAPRCWPISRPRAAATARRPCGRRCRAARPRSESRGQTPRSS